MGVDSPWLIDTWDTDDGLPQNSVSCLAQTDDGRLWVGTLLGGIAHFDGVNFRSFDPSNTPQLERLEIRSLSTADDGTLWIAQLGGSLATFSNRQFKVELSEQDANSNGVERLLFEGDREKVFVTLQGRLLIVGANTRFVSLPDAQANMEKVCASADGTIWYATNSGQLARWRNGQGNVVGANQGRVSSLVCDVAGDIWVGGDLGFENITTPGDFHSLRVDQLATTVDGSLWVRGESQFRKFRDGKFIAEAIGLPEFLLDLPANQLELSPDQSGGVWLISRYKGAWHVDSDGTITSVARADGLPAGLLEASLVDREGNLWLGFNGGGLARVRRGGFHIARLDGKPKVARSICEDAAGSLWIGSAEGRLSRIASDGSVHDQPLPPTVRDVIAWPEQDDKLWVGSVGNGAWILEGGELTRPFPPEKIGTVVRAGLCDHRGHIWIGSEAGLYLWSDENLRKFGAESGFTGQYVLTLAEDAEGAIWVGTAEGTLWRYKNGQFNSWTLPGALKFRFWSLLATEDGAVWIGTLAGGLLRWRDGNLQRASAADGLPSDSIAQILTDQQGSLWAGSRAGLFSIKLDQLNAFYDGTNPALDVRTFTVADGLPAMEFPGGFHPNCFRSNDGTMWFSTVKGAIAVVPDRIPFNALPPTVLIESLEVNDIQQATGGVLSLPPGRYSSNFHFTATSLVAPEKIQFQWRLQGLEEAWVDGGNARSARYSFLPPGDYEFQVRACNNDGVWNETGASMKLVIAPHFWQTLWFKTTAPLTALALVGLGLYSYLRSRHRRELETLTQNQALHDERARIARDLHDDLGVDLTQLIWLCEGAADKGSVELSEIGEKSRGMSQSIDEIVWAVEPRNDTLEGLVHYICQFAEDFLRSREISCRLDVDESLPTRALESILRHHSFLIAREAIHNAARHSGASEIHVSIHTDETGATIQIRDNGEGFDTDSSASGNGLRNMHERARNLKTELKIESRPGGTTVTFKLPF